MRTYVKNRRPWGLLAALAVSVVFGAVAADAPDAEDDRIPQIAVLIEWIELDHREANKLLQKFHSGKGADATALRDTLETKLDDDEAKLHETSFLILSNGTRGKVQSNLEFIYPTEIEFDKFMGGMMEDPRPQPPLALSSLVPWCVSAMDVRNVGIDVELEPVIDPSGRTINLNVATTITRYMGKRKISDPKYSLLAYQPIFNEIEDSTNISLGSGDYALIGVHKAPGAPEKRILVMLRANILK